MTAEVGASLRRGVEDVEAGNVKRLDWVTTAPSEGSRRCMIYRDAGRTVVESVRRIESAE